MILATDVHYQGDERACAAGVAFYDWPDDRASARYTVPIAPIAPYEPGAFYKRELPCLLALLDSLPETPRIIVIDGFVHLGRDARPGLGAHLFGALGGRVPVIGVAKSAFRETTDTSALRRGQSKTPLFVTAQGLSQDAAKACISAMHGPYRVPSLLAEVDRLCRSGL